LLKGYHGEGYQNSFSKLAPNVSAFFGLRAITLSFEKDEFRFVVVDVDAVAVGDVKSAEEGAMQVVL
jgi:hypothetical protein